MWPYLNLKEGKFRRGNGWEVLSKELKIMIPYCQNCGRRNCVLHVHHKIPWRFSKNNSFNNLIVLCKSCHRKMERRREHW